MKRNSDKKWIQEEAIQDLKFGLLSFISGALCSLVGVLLSNQI